MNNSKNIPHHLNCLWNLSANRVLIEKDLKLRDKTPAKGTFWSAELFAYFIEHIDAEGEGTLLHGTTQSQTEPGICFTFNRSKIHFRSDSSRLISLK